MLDAVTTGTLAPSTTAPPARLRTSQRRCARLTGCSLLAVTVASLLAAALLARAEEAPMRVAVAAAFAVVAVLDVAVGAGLYRLLHRRAHSSAYAALVSRAGYAVLLGASAGRLAWPGGGGVERFRADWSLALLVLGVHLLVTALALTTSRTVPAAIVAATALAGVAAVLAESLGRWTGLEGRPALVPLALGQLVLMAWLLRVAHRAPVASPAWSPVAGAPR